MTSTIPTLTRSEDGDMTTNLVRPPVRTRATANVTPFTYYDGATYLEILEALRKWLRDVLVPEFDGLSEYIDEQIADMVAVVDQEITANKEWTEQQITDLTAYVDNAVQQIINESIEVQDEVVSGLITGESETSRVLNLAINQPQNADSQKSAPSLGAGTSLMSASEILSETGATTIYMPSIVNMEGAGLAQYHAYWSTDHEEGPGGAFMAYSENVKGPWTIYGRVYLDTESGHQTETPWVMRLDSGEFIMYYHQRDPSANYQPTYYTLSTDGVNWGGRAGTAMSAEGMSSGATEHVGYMRAYRRGPYGWVAYTLYGGGGGSSSTMLWHSTDGKEWVPEFPPMRHSLYIGEREYTPFMAHLFEYRGALWGSFSGSVFARMSEDLKGIEGPAIPVSGSPTYFVNEGDALYSVHGSTTSGIYVREVL